MPGRKDEDKLRQVNPAMRRDRPGGPHGDDAAAGDAAVDDTVKGYQDAQLDPKDAGGIGG